MYDLLDKFNRNADAGKSSRMANRAIKKYATHGSIDFRPSNSMPLEVKGHGDK